MEENNTGVDAEERQESSWKTSIQVGGHDDPTGISVETNQAFRHRHHARMATTSLVTKATERNEQIRNDGPHEQYRHAVQVAKYAKEKE